MSATQQSRFRNIIYKIKRFYKNSLKWQVKVQEEAVEAPFMWATAVRGLINLEEHRHLERNQARDQHKLVVEVMQGHRWLPGHLDMERLQGQR